MTGVLKVDDIQDAGANSIVSSNGSGTLTFGNFTAATITASTALVPDASDGAALGTTALEWSDLFLADGAVISLGDDQDVTLTHVADTGILLNSTNVIQFNDASQNIGAPSATVLDINATDEIELNATLVDINANVEISGTATTTGVHTFTATPVFSSDITVTDDINLISDSAQMTFGANNEITLTHVHDSGLALKHTATADDKPIVLTLQTGETDMAANDVIGKIAFQAPNEGTGTDAILVSGAIQAVAEGDHSSSSNATRLEFMTGASEAATTKMLVTSGGDVKFNSGFGSVTTVFGCRAWALVNQTGTQAIKGSGNVSSITDNGVGATDVNFSTNMPDGNYCTSCSPGGSLLATSNQQFPVTLGNDGVANVAKGVIGSRQCDNDGDTFAAADSAQVSIAFFR